MIDIEHYVNLSYDKEKETTRARLQELINRGFDEVMTAEFGYEGIVSGLYIEKVWSMTDAEWDDYVEWALSVVDKKRKLKKVVLMVSQNFMADHKRKGDPTNFVQSIQDKVKIHTLRFDEKGHWEKSFKKIEEGKAFLSIKIWTGKPYYSTPKEIFRLYKEDGIGLQKIGYMDDEFCSFDKSELVAENDGLSPDDFNEWFKKVKIGQRLVILHFTGFRYQKQ